MSNIGKWNAPSATVTVLSSEMDSLANNTMTVASVAIANQSNLNIYADIEVNLTAFSPSAGAYVALYILEAIDGTDYPAQSNADLRLTSTQLLCTMPIGVAASTGQRVVTRNIVIPPGIFKIQLDNQTGVAFSTGNTVKFNMYNINLNG